MGTLIDLSECFARLQEEIAGLRAETAPMLEKRDMPKQLHKWEILEVDPGKEHWLERCPVPGGWLYRTREYAVDESTSTAKLCGHDMVFVPDPALEGNGASSSVFADKDE